VPVALPQIRSCYTYLSTAPDRVSSSREFSRENSFRKENEEENLALYELVQRWTLIIALQSLEDLDLDLVSNSFDMITFRLYICFRFPTVLVITRSSN
jgi:hypothetical protein